GGTQLLGGTAGHGPDHGGGCLPLHPRGAGEAGGGGEPGGDHLARPHAPAPHGTRGPAAAGHPAGVRRAAALTAGLALALAVLPAGAQTTRRELDALRAHLELPAAVKLK